MKIDYVSPLSTALDKQCPLLAFRIRGVSIGDRHFNSEAVMDKPAAETEDTFKPIGKIAKAIVDALRPKIKGERKSA